jgi:hypothetical protein
MYYYNETAPTLSAFLKSTLISTVVSDIPPTLNLFFLKYGVEYLNKEPEILTVLNRSW